MTNQELITWHNEEWWPRYRNFVETPVKNQRGPGGRGESLAKIIRMKSSQELRERLIANIIAQTRHRRMLCDKLGLDHYLKHTAKKAKGGESIYKNRRAVTYLNNMGWEDEIPSVTERIRADVKKCFCGKDVHGPNYGFCAEHLSSKNRPMRMVK